MDIKSIKSKNKKRNIFTFIVLVVMLILSFTMIYRYHYVEVKVQKNKSNPFESEEYASDLYNTNYYLYYKSYQAEKNKLIKPSDLFLSEETIKSMVDNVNVDYYSSEMDSYSIKNAFNNSFDDLNDFLLNSYGNIKYYCENTETGYNLANYDFKNFDIESLKKVFMNYVVIEYDNKGHGKMLACYGINKDSMNNYFLDLESNKNIGEMSFINGDPSSDFSNYKIESIKNMKFVYAVPRSINANFYTSYDSVSNYINKSERNSYKMIETIARVLIFIIAVITLLIPTEKLNWFRGLNRFNKLPFEIIFTIFVFLYSSLLSDSAPIKIVRETITGNLLKLTIANGVKLGIAKQVVNLMNIGYWFLVFLMAFICTSLVKMAFKMGILKYMSQKSLIVRLFTSLFSEIARVFRSLINTDFEKRYNRLFLIGIIIVALGFLSVVSVFVLDPSIWIVILIVYLIVFIIFAKVVACEIRQGSKDYVNLLDLTKEIANGNLEKDITGKNVGVYEEVKRQLVSIQKAYKKSVDEEIKSQKMKSELISNVSHDLKTPLTSILTYTDLLKTVETSEESQKYIDTIYKKSERLKVLIDDMFEISKAQTGNISLDMNDIDVVELMKQSIFELGDRMKNKNITIKTDFPEEKVILNLDGEKTYRIFENLLVNISKYAMENTRAYIEINNIENKQVEIVFKNISATEIDYEVDDILERFKRGDKSRNTEGSGLGLSIAKGYVEAQGGSLDLYLDGDLFKAVITFRK